MLAERIVESAFGADAGFSDQLITVVVCEFARLERRCHLQI